MTLPRGPGALEREQALREGERDVLELVARGTPLPYVLEGLLRMIEAQSDGMLCSILLLSDDKQRLRHAAAPSLPSSFTRAIDGEPIGPQAGSCGTAAYRREQVIVRDIAEDPLWDDYREIALETGLRASWSTPIVSSEADVLGTFAMYYREPRLPSTAEQQLIDLAVHLGGVAIEREKIEAELRESRATLELLLEQLPAILATNDRELRFTSVLGAGLAALGAKAGDNLGRTLQDYIHEISGEDPENHIVVINHRRALAGEDITYEENWAGRDYLVRVRPLYDGEGTVSGTISISLDVTESRRAEKERERLEQELRHVQKMEAIGRLAGGIAHDFNNVLTAITGYTELLMERLPPDERIEAEQVRDAAARATALTRQLLAFARRQVVQRVHVDVNEIVCGIDQLLRPLIGANIELVTALSPRLEAIEADPGQIEQILINLAINARDAMSDGGKLVIETSPQWVGAGEGDSLKPGNYVRLTIGDTGTGIDPDAIEHIFEPFFTTKELGHGTGLGLATVHGIVHQLGGSIAVESERDSGTRFTILLPVSEDAPAIPETTDPAELTSLTGTETILLVEDEDSVRALATRILIEHGYRVLEARYASEALELWQQHHEEVDLVLSDIVMPGTSGAQLARRLTSEREDLRVLLMSGFADSSTVERDGGGQMAFLEKPFTPRTLLRAVREAIER